MSAPEDVDTLIAAATRAQDSDTLGAVIRALDATEVFYRATVTSTADGQRVTTPLVRLSDGAHALVVYTSKSHPDLPTKFGGAPWRHVLKMAAGLPAADWLIVATSSGGWLPIDKGQINAIITGLEASEHREVRDTDVAELHAESSLERLISEALDAPPDSWPARVIGSLRGRELFVRISPEPSADGRPVMITSEAGDVRGLVQAYTSRSRPGITYGGMTWEAIVDMVADSPEIPGVHIINDHDDWIVLGRSEI